MIKRDKGERELIGSRTGGPLPTPLLLEIPHTHRDDGSRLPPRWRTTLHRSRRRRWKHPRLTIRPRAYVPSNIPVQSIPTRFPHQIPSTAPIPSPKSASRANRRKDPKSLTGTRLLPTPAFHTPSPISTITLLPSPKPSLLLTSPTGSLALLTPLAPSTHLTLSTLQSHLQSTLSQPLGLNPRSFRSMGGGGGDASGRGGVVDGNLIRRWNEGGVWRRWGGEEKGVLRGVVGGLGRW